MATTFLDLFYPNAVIPPVDKVEAGFDYGLQGNNLTGTLVVTAGGVYPPDTAVLTGNTYGPNGNDFTGRYTAPAANTVVSTTFFAVDGLTQGTVAVPAEANVAAGIDYGPDSGLTGTLVVDSAITPADIVYVLSPELLNGPAVQWVDDEPGVGQVDHRMRLTPLGSTTPATGLDGRLSTQVDGRYDADNPRVVDIEAINQQRRGAERDPRLVERSRRWREAREREAAEAAARADQASTDDEASADDAGDEDGSQVQPGGPVED